MFVDGGPVRWFVRDGAPRARRAAVFLHGFAGTGADWDAVRAGLPPEWRGIAPDLPGHGDSGLPPALTFDKFPSMLEALLDSLAIERATLVGYSFGARLALAAATKVPNRVDGLVLESVHPGLKDESLRGERRQRDEEDAKVLEVDGLDAFLERWHARPMFSTRRDAPGWSAEVERKKATNRPRRLAVLMRGLGLSAQPDFRSGLASFAQPMLLIAGEKDPDYVSHAKELQAQRPDSRALVLAPCGHNVHVESPLVFRQGLHGFLDAINGRSS